MREAPDPEPGAGEIRVRVKAAGINFADLMARVGLYPDAPKVPCVVGYEAAGLVDAVGPGVTAFSTGDRVIVMPKFGGYSDTIAISAEQAIRMPDAMTFEEGAALPVVYLTAHHMLFHTGVVHEGARVLLHSAAGGVGIAALQLLAARKAVVIGTASSSKHAFLRENGCQHPIDSQGDVAAAVRSIVGDAGVDIILDPVGGPSWNDGYKLLAPCGRLVAFGLSAAGSGKTRSLLHAAAQVLRIKKYSPIDLMNDNKTVSGVNMGHLFARIDILKPQLKELIALYEKGVVRPRVDKSFSFDEAPLAHHYIHDRKAVGKVVLVP